MKRAASTVVAVLTLAAGIACGDSQRFDDTVFPGFPNTHLIATDALGPINQTLTWSGDVTLRSEIYLPGQETPEAISESPSPQILSIDARVTGSFTIKIIQLTSSDPTDYTLTVSFPTLATEAWAGNEARDDPARPPHKWIFTSGQIASPMFEIAGGDRGFVDYSLDGGQTYTTQTARYVINNGAMDVMTVDLPGFANTTAVTYRYRAVAPDGSEARQQGNSIYIVSDLPIQWSEIPDNPPFYRGEGMATPSPPAWRDQSIYQVVTDRFYNGNPANDRLGFNNYNPANGGTIHGGDWAGLMSKLDYLRELGVSAIWVSPVLQNFRAYHGYAAINFLLPARQMGTLDEFRNFVDAAHERGIYVIMDVVTNHEANLIYHTDGDYTFRWPQGHPLDWAYNGFASSGKPLPYPQEFRDLNVFHNYGTLRDYNDQDRTPSQAILGNLSGLDDFKTETSFVRSALARIYKWWIANTDVDGFRIDAVKHVDIGFWHSFCPAIRSYARSIGKDNFFLLGEVYNGDDYRPGYYTGTRAGGPFALDSVVYFPMFFDIERVFKGNRPTTLLDQRYSLNYHYDSPDKLVTFVDNHDNSRFLYGSGSRGVDRLKLALTFIYTSRGIPALYYGTEQGFNGPRRGGCTGGDCNREDMFDNPAWDANRDHPGDNFNTGHPLFLWVKRLNEIRRTNTALRRGEQVQRWNNPNGAGLYIYTRTYQGQEVLVVLNTSSRNETATPRVTSSILPPGTTLTDQLSGQTVTTYNAGGGVTRVNINVGPYGARIFAR